MSEIGRMGPLHGQRTWYFPNGDKWVGEMRNNRDWNTTGYDKNGNIIGRVVNGVNQKKNLKTS